jgi:hypothetical protein
VIAPATAEQLPEQCAIFDRKLDPRSQKDQLISAAAELYARECYRLWFTSRERGHTNPIVTYGRMRFELDEARDPHIRTLMGYLDSDFTNSYSDDEKKALKKLRMITSSKETFLTLLQEQGSGGDRKPDALGIANRGASLLVDAVEVTTFRDRRRTFQELHDKLDTIRGLERTVLARIRSRAEQGRGDSSVSYPTSIETRPSPWRLSEEQLICPLPLKADKNGPCEWLCFAPSKYCREPPPRRGQGPPRGAHGEDGLVLYHVHVHDRMTLPGQVRKAIRDAAEKARREAYPGPHLVPGLAGAMGQHWTIVDNQTKKVLAYAGVAILVAIVLFVAWEVLAPIGAAEAVTLGLEAIAASAGPKLAGILASSIMLGQRLAPAMSHVLDDLRHLLRGPTLVPVFG